MLRLQVLIAYDSAAELSTHSNAAITIIPFFADMMFVDQLEEKIRAYHRRAEQAWVRVMGPSSDMSKRS